MKKSTKKKLKKVVTRIGSISWQVTKKIATGSFRTSKSIVRVARKKSKALVSPPASFSRVNVASTVEGSFSELESSLLDMSLVALIFGKRGSGKSTLAFRMMENIHAKTKRPCFVLGVKQSLLPSWIEEVQSLDQVKRKGLVLVDEGALSFNARESMSKKNTALGKLLAVARHKDLTLLLVTQNTGMIDKNVLSLTDLVIAKEGSLLQKKMERAAVKDFVNTADLAIKALAKNDRVKHAYVFSDDFEGLLSIPLPSFWSEKVSKSRR